MNLRDDSLEPQGEEPNAAVADPATGTVRLCGITQPGR